MEDKEGAIELEETTEGFEEESEKKKKKTKKVSGL